MHHSPLKTFYVVVGTKFSRDYVDMLLAPIELLGGLKLRSAVPIFFSKNFELCIYIFNYEFLIFKFKFNILKIIWFRTFVILFEDENDMFFVNNFNVIWDSNIIVIRISHRYCLAICLLFRMFFLFFLSLSSLSLAFIIAL